mgnify:CR=1 FL=1
MLRLAVPNPVRTSPLRTLPGVLPLMRSPRRTPRGFMPSLLPLEDRLTPATFYLDPSTSTGDTVFNAGNPGETTGLTFGTNLFNNLDNALSAASGSIGPDVIQLASGNIPVPNGGGLPYGIFQDVTLNGNGPSVLVPTVNSSNGSTSVLLISNGAAVNLSNLTFDGSGFDVGIGIQYSGFGTAGTLTNVTIRDIDFQGDNTAIALFVSTPDSTGTFTRVDVTNSTISNYGATGIYYALALGTVSGTTITGQNGGTAETYYGIVVDGQTGTGSVTITGSTITGNLGTLTGEPNSAGVLIRSIPLVGPDSIPAVTIFGCQLTGNTTGVLANPNGGDSFVTMRYNNIFGNTTGFDSSGGGTPSQQLTDANWWGTPTGPTNGANPGGTGNPVAGSPVFQPFVTRGPVPVASAATIAAYRIANSTLAETTVNDVTTLVSANPQTLTLSASVSGTNVVGTVTFRVVAFGGGQIGSTVQAAVVNGVATASYTLPGGTLPDFYSIEADFNPGVELLTANTGANGLLRVNPQKLYAAGAGTGSGAGVKVYNPDNSVKFTSNPLGGATAGARVAMADVTGDGVDDLVVGAGPGGPSTVVVIDGRTQAEVARFLAFEPTFTGGVYVAAGDIDGDGKAEVIVSPDQGGGPVVAIYRGSALATGAATELVRYFGITDDSFRGGARPAVGDVNGDGTPDVVVSAGFLGGPRIQVWSGAVLATGTKPADSLANFFAFEDTLRNGCFVSAGDVNGDGFADLIFGGGPGGGPRVRIADGKALLAAGGFGTLDNPSVAGLTIANFFAGNDQNRGGVRVSATDLDRDGLSEVFTGSGDGEQSTVRRYNGTAVQASSSPSPAVVFDPFGVIIAGGVFVG